MKYVLSEKSLRNFFMIIYGEIFGSKVVILFEK